MAALYKVRLAPIMRHGKLLLEGDTFEAEESEVVNLVIGSDPVVELVKPVKATKPPQKPETVSQFAPPVEVSKVAVETEPVIPSDEVVETEPVGIKPSKPKYIKP